MKSLLQEVTTQSGLPPSQLSKAISRISTEYRLQFAWPRRPQLTNGETMAPEVLAAGLPAGTTGPPRKSLSMGALKQGIAPTGPAPVHKKRPGDVDHKRDGKWNISTNFFSSDPTCVCFPRGLEPFQVEKSIDLFSHEDVSPSGIFLTFACFSFPFFSFFFLLVDVSQECKRRSWSRWSEEPGPTPSTEWCPRATSARRICRT